MHTERHYDTLSHTERHYDTLSHTERHYDTLRAFPKGPIEGLYSIEGLYGPQRPY